MKIGVLKLLRCFLKFVNKLEWQFLKTNVVGSGTEQNLNPYTLVCYRRGWSKNRIAKNNDRYWQWEIEHNRLK